MNEPTPNSSWLILGLLLLFFIATNLGLWAAYKRRNQKNQDHWMSKLGNSIMNPLQKDKQKLDELANEVKKLRIKDRQSDNKQENSPNQVNDVNEDHIR